MVDISFWVEEIISPTKTLSFWIGVFVVAAVHYWLFRPRLFRNGKPLRKAPNTWWVVGNGLHFLQPRHKLFAWFVKCERIFGYETFAISVPTLPLGVVINDPKNLEFVFKNEAIFGKGDFVKSRSWDLFGHGIINVDGDLWKVQRKAGLQFLNTANMKVLTEVALPEYLENTVNDLSRIGGYKSVDLQNVFHELTTQLMGRMAYDMDMHSADEFSTAFEYASGKTAERFQNPLWRLTELITGWRLRKSLAIVKSFGNDIVTRAQQSRDHSKVKEENGIENETTDLTNENDSRLSPISGSLINALLDSIATPQIVADAALNYLSAGRDTTAQSLTWAFYSLSQHPETITSIRREIQALITPEQTLDPRLLTPDRCPYILAVFYETLRLYPPVPFEIKQVLQPTVLPDGTQLSSSFVLVWCTWAMNRSFTTWGTDAAAFRPERWLDNNNKIVHKSAFEFPVFNGGARMCLGKRMAEMMAVMVIGRLAWSFDFEMVEEGEKRTGSSLTLPMEGGLEVFVRPVER